jgi:hypothetical protein
MNDRKMLLIYPSSAGRATVPVVKPAAMTDLARSIRMKRYGLNGDNPYVLELNESSEASAVIIRPKDGVASFRSAIAALGQYWEYFKRHGFVSQSGEYTFRTYIDAMLHFTFSLELNIIVSLVVFSMSVSTCMEMGLTPQEAVARLSSIFTSISGVSDVDVLSVEFHPTHVFGRVAPANSVIKMFVLPYDMQEKPDALLTVGHVYDRDSVIIARLAVGYFIHSFGMYNPVLGWDDQNFLFEHYVATMIHIFHKLKHHYEMVKGVVVVDSPVNTTMFAVNLLCAQGVWLADVEMKEFLETTFSYEIDKAPLCATYPSEEKIRRACKLVWDKMGMPKRFITSHLSTQVEGGRYLAPSGEYYLMYP